MADPIRYHLDEHIDGAIARALRAAGIDVTTTIESRLQSKDDDAQIAFGVLQRRMVVTDDVDFLAMANSGLNHSGIVYCHRRFRTLGQILATLIWVHANFTAAEMFNRVVHVSKSIPQQRNSG